MLKKRNKAYIYIIYYLQIALNPSLYRILNPQNCDKSSRPLKVGFMAFTFGPSKDYGDLIQ